MLGALLSAIGFEGAMSQSAAPGTTVSVQGVLTEGGIVCPLLKASNGELIPLMGVRLGQFPLGTALDLEGVMVKRSPCQQGRQTLQVSRIVAVDGIKQ